MENVPNELLSKDLLIRKLNKYEGIIAAVGMSPKQFGKIISEGNTIGNVTFHRVDLGHQEIVLPISPIAIFGQGESLKVEVGTEVLISNNAIIDIIPEKLKKIAKESKISLIPWEEIGGLNDQLKAIREAVELPFKNPELVKEYGISPIAGILLYGPPGCGKTLIAKAIANSIFSDKNVPGDAFISISGGDILDKYVGETEKIISATFKRSRSYSEKSGKRGIIFLDEAEAILARRSNNQNYSAVPGFLAEMDGMNSHKPLVILATNMEKTLDPAVVRDNRVDLRLYIGRPDKAGFQKIILVHLNKILCKDKKESLAEFAMEKVFGSAMKETVNGAMASSLVRFSAMISLNRFLKDKGAKGLTEEDMDLGVKKLLSQHMHTDH